MAGGGSTLVDLEKADPNNEKDRLSGSASLDGQNETGTKVAMLVLKTLAGLFVIGLAALALSTLRPLAPLSYNDLFDSEKSQYHVELIRMTLLVSIFWAHACTVAFTQLLVPNTVNYFARLGVHLLLPVTKSFEYLATCSHHAIRVITSITLWASTFKLFPYALTLPC